MCGYVAAFLFLALKNIKKSFFRFRLCLLRVETREFERVFDQCVSCVCVYVCRSRGNSKNGVVVSSELPLTQTSTRSSLKHDEIVCVGGSG